MRRPVPILAIRSLPAAAVSSCGGEDRAAAFEMAYRDGLSTRYTCRKASDKPYLRPQVPVKTEAAVIDFDPKADRPA